MRVGEALPLRRRHLDVDGGRVVVEVAVTELPGGPVIVVEAVRRYLVTVPDGPEIFVFPGRQKHPAARPAEL